MKKKIILLVLIISIFTFSGCTIQIGSNGGSLSKNFKIINTKNVSKVIEKEEINEAALNISMGVGRLNIEGGSDKLMDGKFTYNVENWEPIVDYTKDGTKGTLSISQPSVNNISNTNNIKYEWNLKFNKDIAYAIDAKLGVGESNIDLTNLKLKKLDVKLGVGKSNIDISGNYKNDIDVDIKGGIGDTTIYVPKNMSVTLDSSTGIGNMQIDGFQKNGSTYSNDQNSQYKMHINVDCGIGRISLKQK